MRKIFLVLIGLLLMTSSCSQPASEPVPAEKALTLVNAAVVDADLLETLRQFMEKELHVMVRTVEKPEFADKKDFQTLETAALGAKQENDAAYIVITSFDVEDDLVVDAENSLALINALPFKTDDAETFATRMKRMVMRAAAFSFGLEPTPDPYCVTRDYRSLEDFDRMGINYSPPWQGRYADEAAKRGLEPITPKLPEGFKNP